VRLALGAQASDVLRLIIVMVSRWCSLESPSDWQPHSFDPHNKELLFGVSATDPLTFFVISLVLIGTALLAAWDPGLASDEGRSVDCIEI